MFVLERKRIAKQPIKIAKETEDILNYCTKDIAFKIIFCSVIKQAIMSDSSHHLLSSMSNTEKGILFDMVSL